MATKQSGKANLSKHLLQMKFMQRSALRVQREEYEQDTRIDDEHWRRDIVELKQKQSKFILEPSFTYCEELRFGRMSHKGFNPEIEKIMRAQDKDLELVRAEEREKETSVNDEEMAKRYSSLIGTIAKKFTKRGHQKQVDSDESEGSEDGEILPQAKNRKKKKYNVTEIRHTGQKHNVKGKR